MRNLSPFRLDRGDVHRRTAARTGLKRGAISLALAFVLLVSACGPRTSQVEPVLTAAGSPAPTSRPVESATLIPSPTLTLPPPTATSTATATPEPSPTPTPDPYASYRLDYLAQRNYGGGEIRVEKVLAVNSYFTRTLVVYPSDGLDIFGFMNQPARGEGPFPVVIALHGYIEPEIYDTIDYTTRYADTLARNGFLVLHPNLRGYPPSSDGDNLFRVGMAEDVLNLIAIVKAQAGKPGPLEQADPEAIGLWGHSMGGGVSTRVITVSPDVQAAVLYAPMSGDERQNFEAINSWSYGLRGLDELAVPVEELETISPIHYLERITAAVSIHHGRADELVPLRWSVDLCERLTTLEKEVECFWYDDAPHTFYGEWDALFEQRVVEFFNRTLR